jgi:hypothetical protein
MTDNGPARWAKCAVALDECSASARQDPEIAAISELAGGVS